MEFEEIAYWIAAVMEHGEAVRARLKRRRRGRNNQL
jgi:hypothetical protein